MSDFETDSMEENQGDEEDDLDFMQISSGLTMDEFIELEGTQVCWEGWAVVACVMILQGKSGALCLAFQLLNRGIGGFFQCPGPNCETSIVAKCKGDCQPSSPDSESCADACFDIKSVGVFCVDRPPFGVSLFVCTQNG